MFSEFQLLPNDPADTILLTYVGPDAYGWCESVWKKPSSFTQSTNHLACAIQNIHRDIFTTFQHKSSLMNLLPELHVGQAEHKFWYLVINHGLCDLKPTSVQPSNSVNNLIYFQPGYKP